MDIIYNAIYRNNNMCEATIRHFLKISIENWLRCEVATFEKLKSSCRNKIRARPQQFIACLSERTQINKTSTRREERREKERRGGRKRKKEKERELCAFGMSYYVIDRYDYCVDMARAFEKFSRTSCFFPHFFSHMCVLADGRLIFFFRQIARSVFQKSFRFGKFDRTGGLTSILYCCPARGSRLECAF